MKKYTPTLDSVAVVGTGIIGRGWIQIFARAGCRTRVYDKDLAQAKKALVWLEDDLELGVTNEFITPQEKQARLALVSAHDDLAEAVSGAQYIQESGPERLDIKRAIYTDVDQVADPAAIIASSTSALDMSEIAGGLDGEHRCIMAHPFNPPHIVPVVEVMASRGTDPDVVTRALEFLTSVGQKPILLKTYIMGYLINRIQAAVVREAIHLVQNGIADVNAVDTVIRDGLALRWVLLGNFGVNNTNADGGVREYFTRFGGSYQAIMNDLDSMPPTFDADMVERIGQGVDVMEGGASVSDICRWRDRMVLKIRALEEQDPHPGRS